MIKAVNKLIDHLNIDSTIAITILSRIIQTCGGVISIFFIARFLNADEQGYYYTFASIIAIQVFFEMGLSGIITQYTAHEFAHLKWDENQNLIGDEQYKSRLSSLLRFCVKWFMVIAIALFFVLLIVGFYFFNQYNKKLNINWQNPWIILSLSTALNLIIDPILAFFDGLGEVRDMAKVRLIQKSFNVILLFVFFALGFKLYSSALASLLAISINYVQIIFTKRFILLKNIWNSKNQWFVSYYNEIFPYQWRIALSWISGYFIFQLFNPVLFATEGPKIAGQMGMTLQALNGISALSMSWITTKIPQYSSYIAKKEYNKLDDLFYKSFKSMLLVTGVLLVIFVISVYVLKKHHLPLEDRFLPIIPTVMFSITCFVNMTVFNWATYLRCHKQEPFLINSIVIGALTATAVFFIGTRLGLLGITYSYFAVIMLVSLPWSFYIFKSKKQQWHSNAT